MDTYRWQHHNAVVTRLYYSERLVELLFGGAAAATALDSWFIYKGYFAKQARARIPKVSYQLHNCYLVLGILLSLGWSLSIRPLEATH